MSNRIIKESICSSEKISSLTDFEFRLWVGLITQVDDAGRGDARPAIIKGRVFPLRDRVTVKDVDVALHALAAKGCVSLYEVGGKPYFWFPSWAEHQRIRDCKPKYPGPGEGDFSDNSPPSAADCGNSPPSAALIQSESKSESETESTPPLTPHGGEGAEALFEEFWEAYPRKIGHDAALKAWKKLNPGRDMLTVMLDSIARWKKSEQWYKEDGRYIPSPTKWLNNGCWKDDPKQRHRIGSYDIEDLENGPEFRLPDNFWGEDDGGGHT